MALPVALQLYSVRDELEADFEGTIAKVKEFGYDGVEFAGLYGKSAEQVKKILADAGLTPVSAHVPYLDMVKDPEGVLGTYAAIGCKYVAIPHLNEELRPGTEKFPEVMKNIAMLGKVANSLGLTLLYHNHDFEFIKINGKYGLDTLYETVPADLLKTELDVCWVKVGGEEPAAYIKKYSGRAPVVHLKDFYGEKSESMYELIGVATTKPVRPDGFEFRPLGKGLQNFPPILEAAKEAGTEWVVVEQDRPSLGLTPMECAKVSIDYLKTINK